ncbi:MAG TPA: transcriptional regulator, partial [Symbiobacteriaceae bacterium]|nr:transcriptional regulator [Symbiobacteriaceae bacterium]
MTDIDRLTNASLEELKQGYVEAADRFTCLCCGEPFEKGIIYPADGRLYEAGRFTRHHIETEHGSVFDYLLSLDKSATGLT